MSKSTTTDVVKSKNTIKRKLLTEGDRSTLESTKRNFVSNTQNETIPAKISKGKKFQKAVSQRKVDNQTTTNISKGSKQSKQARTN